MFEDADPTVVLYFNAWEKSVVSDSGLSRTVNRLYRRAPVGAREALWSVFEACYDLYPFSRECSIQMVNLTDHLIGSRVSIEYFSQLPKQHRQEILQHHSRLDRRLFSAYLMSLKIAGNPIPAILPRKYLQSEVTPETAELRDYLGSEQFIETVNKYGSVEGHSGAETLFCLLRQTYGEDKIIHLLTRLMDESFHLNPRAIVRLLHSWDEVKTQPFEWSLAVIPNPLESR